MISATPHDHFYEIDHRIEFLRNGDDPQLTVLDGRDTVARIKSRSEISVEKNFQRYRMIKNLLTPLVMIVSLLTTNSLAIAHHGTNAEYDSEHPITFAFSNPHVQIYFDVKDEKGKIVHWAAEAPSPGRLIRMGWTRNGIKAGDQITIVVDPARSGATVGGLRKVVLANGKELGVVHGYEGRAQ
jgi:hypothetical protein